MTVNIEQVRESLTMEMEGSPLSIKYLGVFPIQEWDEYSPNHDGIDSCTHFAKIVVLLEDYDGPYLDGFEIPLEPSLDGTLHMAGWHEIDTPDAQAMPYDEAQRWVAAPQYRFAR